MYTRDFNHLLQDWFLPLPIQFTLDELEETDMFTTQAANAVTKMFKVIDSVGSEIERSGFTISRSDNKHWWDSGEYGIYVYCKDEEVLWFGVWTDFWKDRGCPLSIGVDLRVTPAIIERFKKAFPDLVHYPPSSATPYLTKCVDKHFLMGDSVRDLTKWLSKEYLEAIK